MAADDRGSLVQEKNVTMITTNMIAAPPIHITAPPWWMSFSGVGPQLRGAIGEWTLWVGIIKAPFFAAIISMVGCYEGFNVSGSADSVGRLTTQSVVESIFLVIVADAAFSIIFSLLKI